MARRRPASSSVVVPPAVMTRPYHGEPATLPRVPAGACARARSPSARPHARALFARFRDSDRLRQQVRHPRRPQPRHRRVHAFHEIRQRHRVAVASRQQQIEILRRHSAEDAVLFGDDRVREVVSPHFLTTISTRRFFARPSGLSEPSGFLFGAAGRFAPKPSVVKVIPPRPCPVNHRLTDSARRRERLWL